jgi:hypothetical protein
VRLQPPPAGPAALRHQQRMQRDAAEEAEEENYRAASSVAASSGVRIPPKSSGIYGSAVGGGGSAADGGKALSRQDWGKVLSWAVAIETLQAKQRQLEEEPEQYEEQNVAVEEVVAAAEEAGDELSIQYCDKGLHHRRKHGSGDARSEEAADNKQRRQQSAAAPSAALALAASLWRSFHPLQLALLAAALPWRALQAAGGAARSATRWGLTHLPLVGSYFGGIEELLSLAELEAELDALDQEMKQQLEELAGLEQPASSRRSGKGEAEEAWSTGKGRGGGGGTLRLSEASLRYGLGMLARSSGSPRQLIEPSNSYERQLLAEVRCEAWRDAHRTAWQRICMCCACTEIARWPTPAASLG